MGGYVGVSFVCKTATTFTRAVCTTNVYREIPCEKFSTKQQTQGHFAKRHVVKQPYTFVVGVTTLVYV